MMINNTTIKTVSYVEICSYIWENGISEGSFMSLDHAREVTVLDNHIRTSGSITKHTLFEIPYTTHRTKQTMFRKIAIIYRTHHDGELKTGTRNNKSVHQIINTYDNSDVLKIYAVIDEEFELIYRMDDKPIEDIDEPPEHLAPEHLAPEHLNHPDDEVENDALNKPIHLDYPNDHPMTDSPLIVSINNDEEDY